MFGKESKQFSTIYPVPNLPVLPPDAVNLYPQSLLLTSEVNLIYIVSPAGGKRKHLNVHLNLHLAADTAFF